MITYIICTVQAKEFDYDEALLQLLESKCCDVFILCAA